MRPFEMHCNLQSPRAAPRGINQQIRNKKTGAIPSNRPRRTSHRSRIIGVPVGFRGWPFSLQVANQLQQPFLGQQLFCGQQLLTGTLRQTVRGTHLVTLYST
jgi:hypothetical protein